MKATHSEYRFIDRKLYTWEHQKLNKVTNPDVPSGLEYKSIDGCNLINCTVISLKNVPYYIGTFLHGVYKKENWIERNCLC